MIAVDNSAVTYVGGDEENPGNGVTTHLMYEPGGGKKGKGMKREGLQLIYFDKSVKDKYLPEKPPKVD
jgi:hypothetical protein